MSATTRASRSRPDRAASRRPGLLRLTRLEMRKMVDTRAGFWLILVTALGYAAGVALILFAGPASDRQIEAFLQVTFFPSFLFLPVLGILMVTSEWSQRTALSTFTLVPSRTRVVAAKVLAGVGVALLFFALCLLLAAVGYALAVLLGRTEVTTWSLDWRVAAGLALAEVIFVLVGIGLGLAVQVPALAIVLYFVLPQMFTVFAASVPVANRVLPWIDITGSAGPLIDAAMTGRLWAQLATSVLFWIVLPLAVGTWRTVRREIS